MTTLYKGKSQGLHRGTNSASFCNFLNSLWYLLVFIIYYWLKLAYSSFGDIFHFFWGKDLFGNSKNHEMWLLPRLICHQNILKSTRTNPESFWNILFCIYQSVVLKHEICWKRQAPNQDEDPSNKFVESLDMGSISTRKHEWDFGSYLPENMKWIFANSGSTENWKARGNTKQ